MEQEHKRETLSFIFAGEEQRAPKSFYGPVARREYILHYVMSGKGYCQCNGRTVTVVPGQSFLLYPNELVKYWADDEDPWHYIWVNFDGTEADALMADTAFSPKNRVSKIIPLFDIYPLFHEAVDAFHHEGNPHVKNAKLHMLLALYTRCFPSTTQVKVKRPADILSEYIRGNYMYSGVNANTIAQGCNMSRSQLFRLCKSEFGCSPLQFLTSVRLDHAKYFLHHTDYPIYGIANSVGFDDAMYFTRVFTKAVGMSPTEFRKRMAEEEAK